MAPGSWFVGLTASGSLMRCDKSGEHMDGKGQMGDGWHRHRERWSDAAYNSNLQSIMEEKVK